MIVSPIEWSSPPAAAIPAPNNPPGCPPGCQYVPQIQGIPLIHSAHSSRGTGHPGANNTLSLIRDRFWWPNMARDVRRFVQGCPDCAMSKSPRHLPAGKLLPLPVPNRPWSHLGVDFVTDLPPSEGKTCILVIVDRFSQGSPHSTGDGWITLQPCLPILWHSRRYRIWPGTPIYITGMEGLFPTPRCDSQPLVRISPRI